MKHLIHAVIAFGFASSSIPAMAQEQGHLSVKTVVQKEEVVIDDAGERHTRLVPAGKVVPGDEVVYTVTFANVSDEPADNIVITNPLPAELTYVPNSAFGPGSDVVFSVDGGNTFAPADELRVVEDGVERAATPDDYTHIRWLLRNTVVAGAQGIARFKARLD